MVAMEINADERNLIITRIDEDSGMACNSIMPFDAIAAWGMLLGTTSDSETVAAILTAQDPGILDETTGRNAWTSAYEQLQQQALSDRNQTRSAALYRAVNARGALVPDGRAETRRLLGLPGTPTSDNEPMTLSLDDANDTVQAIPLPDSVNESALVSLLADHADALDAARSRFAEGFNPQYR